MQNAIPELDSAVCPYIDRDDKRCASHFTLRHLNQAFELCIYRHHNCVTYHRIAQESIAEEIAAATAQVRLTIEGEPAHAVIAARAQSALGVESLRPTGS